MFQMFMQFSLALVGVFAVMLVGHAQAQPGFINIDCGRAPNSKYTDSTTKLKYFSDENFINTGERKSVSGDLENRFKQLFETFRIFPEGKRNCYKINVTSGQNYLIRARFVNGNGEKSLPEFELHLGANLWDSVAFNRVGTSITKELIHIPMRNYIHICMVDIGKGVPFISVIELRPLPNGAYQTEVGSLGLLRRDNMAANDNVYRFPSDLNDRIWSPYFNESWNELDGQLVIDRDMNRPDYQLPSDVMKTAATPKDTIGYLYYSWDFGTTASFYIYMHFSELNSSSPSRALACFIDGSEVTNSMRFLPLYLTATTFNTTIDLEGGLHNLSIYTRETTFDVLPILNAIEIYVAKKFLVSETNQQDVEAITNLKSTYKITKNWQGDPCNPQVYMWEGVKCSYFDNNSSRITSLDLSSSGLTGDIAASIENLTMIQTLDLSNNNLSGEIPGYLSQLPELKVLNLDKNELTGSVTRELITKGGDGLSLSLCGNPSLSGQVPCNNKKKKNMFVIPVVVSMIAMLLVSSIAATMWWKRKKKHAVRKFFKLEKSADHGEGTYDVFLSFRGEDTRQSVIGHLHEALTREGIKHFLDDKGLKIGNEIKPSLVAAIEASKISIIIFSQNYVSSSWCLDELVKILECKESKKQRVFPFFYKVEPTEVRHQSGHFVLDESIHYENKDKIPQWRNALTEVANLSGLTYTAGYESDMIKDIVNEILKIVRKQTK